MIAKEVRMDWVIKDDFLSLSKRCELLSLNRNLFYYSPKGESVENKKIKELLLSQYKITPFYGYRKMTVWINEQGFKVNKKRVKRLMRAVGWQTIYREPRTTIVNKQHKKYPYLLKDLEIERKNQVWATDITYIPMEKGFMYLSAIIDLHTRYVVGWDISNTMNASWCITVLENALAQHGKPEIFNTDQGSQYTSEIHTQLLIDNNIKISMDGKRRALDNIFIERLWRTVKYENVYLQAYKDVKALRKGLEEYFEFYNNQRFHQSLKNKTPNEVYHLQNVA